LPEKKISDTRGHPGIGSLTEIGCGAMTPSVWAIYRNEIRGGVTYLRIVIPLYIIGGA
jgi:hypothetical protein